MSPPASRLRDILRQFKKELLYAGRALSQVGLRRMLFGTASAPVLQRPSLFDVDLPVSTIEGLRDYLRQHHRSFDEGRYALYLPPASLADPSLDLLRSSYPPGSGLKLIKRPGRHFETTYSNVDMQPRLSRTERTLLPQPVEQLAIINYGYDLGLFPRAHDLVQIRTRAGMWLTGFVLEDVPASPPSRTQFQTLIDGIEHACGGSRLGLLTPRWMEHTDFRFPEGLRNCRVRGDGTAVYVDFQNFFFINRRRLLREVLQQAKRQTHFGDALLLSGGQCCYQSVPGYTRRHKRDVGARFEHFRNSLDGAGITLEGARVLDVGCNIGMVMGHALAGGSAWAVGIDRPGVVPHARRILHLLGFSRFDVVGEEMTPQSSFQALLPSHFRDTRARPLVIFFLAMHRHIGYPPALFDLPWKAMVFEGHQDDTLESVQSRLAPLVTSRHGVIRTLEIYQDATSRPRPFALLLR